MDNSGFRGINVLTIDPKGRLSLPARYKDLIATIANLVVTIDTEENCLLLYPLKAWEKIEKNLQALPAFDINSRRIQRLLIGHATDLELDKNFRILIPNVLRDYARLTKKVVMIGQGNKFEIWDEQLWQKRREEWLVVDMKHELSETFKDIRL